MTWFSPKIVRQAEAMCDHARKLLHHQRDILQAKTIDEIETAIADVRTAIATKATPSDLQDKMDHLEDKAKSFVPYPNAAWRENIEVLLVALAVAMAIRTFFLQPFKIPTGSMQPTLYGVISVPDFSRQPMTDAYIKRQLTLQHDMKIPTGLQRIADWVHGISYVHVVAQNDGELQAVLPPKRFLIFNIRQTVIIGGKEHTIWFPPDYGEAPLEARLGLHVRTAFGEPGQVFRKGDDVVKMRVTTGDHLFVDRVTYNFRAPRRGDIVVFATAGIPAEMRHGPHWDIPADEFYIKRLVGLGGETLSLHQDYLVENVPSWGFQTVPAGHLVIDGKEITTSTPGFENLYTFFGAHRGSSTLQFVENEYYGHALVNFLAPGQSYHVQPNHYFVMGDNTMNSLDSRYWGDFPDTAVIGRSFFVYWPISDRFGWGYH
jgi:signal peptidase I